MSAKKDQWDDAKKEMENLQADNRSCAEREAMLKDARAAKKLQNSAAITRRCRPLYLLQKKYWVKNYQIKQEN